MIKMRWGLVALFALLIVLIGCIEVGKEPCPPASDEFGNETVIAVTEEAVSEAASDSLPKKVVMEGDLVSFPNLKAVDPDGEAVVYTFSEPLNANGEWQTKAGDSGEYILTITASDGTNIITQKVLLVVKSTNKPPFIQKLSTIKLRIGEALVVSPKVNDPDGDVISISYAGWKTEFPYITTSKDVGHHAISVIASDGKDQSQEDVNIVVEKINTAPRIEPISAITIYELDKVIIVPEAFDAENDTITYSFSKPLDSFGVWLPQRGDAGVYQIEARASDDQLSDITIFSMTVLPYNEPPVFFGVKDIIVNEGELIQLGITAEDPEGKSVQISLSGWMTEAIKQTSYNDAGSYVVTASASDGEKTVSVTFNVTVENKNRSPVFNPSAFR